MNSGASGDIRRAQAAQLRLKAEERLRAREGALARPPTEADARALVHELQVHQIELEMQNEELHRARAQAQEALEKYHDLFDFAPVGYFLWDQDGKILEVNLAGAAMLGFDRNAAIEKRFGLFVAVQDRARFAEFCKRATAAEAKENCEVMLSDGGPPIFVRIEGIAAQGGPGQGALCRAAVVDVTQQKRAEDVLRQSHDELERRVAERTRELAELVVQLRDSDERYRLIAEKVDDVIWTAGRQGAAACRPKSGKAADDLDSVLSDFRLTYVSPAIERLSGHSVEEALRMTIRDWLPAAAFSALLQWIPRERSDVSGHPRTVELEIMAKDGSCRLCEVVFNVVRDSTGAIIAVVGIARDVTERKQLEQDLSRISTAEQERLGQELHDGLAQELTGMGLVAKGTERSLAKDGLPQAESAAALGDMLHSARNHVHALIKGVRPVEVDAEGLMAALTDLAASTEYLTGLACRFDCPRSVTVKDDHAANHLFRIAQEAVRNAVKHSGAKLITVRLSDEGGACLQVEDDGVGIPLDGRRRAGMGLRIMQHRASLLGAVFQVRRTSPRGTLVTCTLGRGSTEQ
jgi:PAS domain S-box-containing protein